MAWIELSRLLVKLNKNNNGDVASGCSKDVERI